MTKIYQAPVYFDTYSSFITEYEAFKDIQRTLPPVVIRRNCLKCSEQTFNQFVARQLESGAFEAVTKVELVADCYEVKAARAIVGGLWEHHIGLFYMLGASSVLPVMALAPKPGERILDMCAAPGGKTMLIAQAMNDQGVIIANEPSNARRQVLKSCLDRMGVTNASLANYYAEDFPSTELFDRILLDGPCSAEGSLRGSWSKRFDYKRNNTYREGLQRSQRKILSRAVELLKPGGRLVYSTCTYDPEENEAQVHNLLNQYENIEIVDSEVPGPWRPGIEKWNEYKFNKKVSLANRVLPHCFNSWGFFFATFIKH